MKSTPQIQHISVGSPCSQDFAKMSGGGVNRHCASCDKTVTDFSKATTEEILLFFTDKASGSVCARFGESQLKSLNRSISTHTMKRRIPIWAASIFLMLLSFTSCVTHNPVYHKRKFIETSTFTVVGAIQSSNTSHHEGDKVVGNIQIYFEKEVLVGAKIYIENTQIGVVTDFDGNFILSLPVDIDMESKVIFSYIGCESLKVDLKTILNKKVNVSLSENWALIGMVITKKTFNEGRIIN